MPLPMRRTPLPYLLLATLVLPLFLAGCTDGDDGGEPSPTPTPTQDPGNDNNTTGENVTQEVGLSGAYPATIAYDPSTITVPANSTVTIVFTNNDQAPLFNHDWVLEGYEDTASTEIIANGETSEVTFEAPPVGTYAFYCSVQGHRENGMEGTFVVE